MVQAIPREHFISLGLTPPDLVPHLSYSIRVGHHIALSHAALPPSSTPHLAYPLLLPTLLPTCHRPDISWDKGRAMLWLLQALELNGRDDVFTIYIGDDTTDEDAFEVRRESHSFETVGSRRTTCICRCDATVDVNYDCSRSLSVRTDQSSHMAGHCCLRRCSRSTSCRAWASW